MLDMGFLPDIKRIISKLPKARQSLFFSATMSPAIASLAAGLVSDPVKIEISPEKPTVDKINQRVMIVPKTQKDALLVHLLKTHPEWTKVIVFTKMRHGADRIVKKLQRADIYGLAIHSDKTQNQRTRALDGFRRGEVRVLVATDIASRGIDVPDVSCVVNTEIPLELESYVHRIGRTARAGESGAAITLLTPEDRPQLKALERFIRKTIQEEPLPSDFVPPSGSPAPQPQKNTTHFRKTDKSTHPANINRANRKRQKHTSFLGRRQPDFGQRG